MSAPSPARRAAFEVLRRVFEEGAWADRALPAAIERHRLAERERGQAQRLAYGSVQRRGSADAVAARYVKRGFERLDDPLKAALRLGVYELLFASATPDHAAVSEAVELAKRAAGRGRGRGGEGLVNAVLRRVAIERDALLAELADDSDPARAALAHSSPLWLAEMWWEQLGAEEAPDLLAAANQPAEHAFRAARFDLEAVLERLRAAGVAAAPAPALAAIDLPDGLVVDGPIGGEGEAMIAAGRIAPQSRASQAVVRLLAPRPGERVLDVCAGPGIKSAQIAAAVGPHHHERPGMAAMATTPGRSSEGGGGEHVAVELDRARAETVAATCARLGVAAPRTLIGDASRLDLGTGYHRILVDAPCSDLGTLAARPDARWRKDPAAIERLAALQGAILDRSAAALAPGGVLVYSTCTISRRENEDVVSALLDGHPELAADDLGAEHPALASTTDARFLQTRPDRDRTSGFFIARLRRSG